MILNYRDTENEQILKIMREFLVMILSGHGANFWKAVMLR